MAWVPALTFLQRWTVTWNCKPKQNHIHVAICQGIFISDRNESRTTIPFWNLAWDRVYESLQAPRKKCLVGSLKSVFQVSDVRLDILISLQASRKKRSLLGENSNNTIRCFVYNSGRAVPVPVPWRKKKNMAGERKKEKVDPGSKRGWSYKRSSAPSCLPHKCFSLFRNLTDVQSPPLLKNWSQGSICTSPLLLKRKWDCLNREGHGKGWPRLG